jgi:hypothetical protein
VCVWLCMFIIEAGHALCASIPVSIGRSLKVFTKDAHGLHAWMSSKLISTSLCERPFQKKASMRQPPNKAYSNPISAAARQNSIKPAATSINVCLNSVVVG